MYERVRTVVRVTTDFTRKYSRNNFCEKEQYRTFSLEIKIDRKNFSEKDHRISQKALKRRRSAMVIYTCILIHLALSFNPRQELIPEGLGWIKELLAFHSQPVNKCFIIPMSILWIKIHYNHIDFLWRCGMWKSLLTR